MADVSVVIPTRDRPELLATAVRSAVTQQDVAVEVIVVDDGSEAPVTLDLPTVHRRTTKVLRTSAAGGVSAARNAGIAAATGAWVAFLDDDDVWAPTKLAKQLAAAAEAGAAWAYAGYVDVDVGLEVVGGGPPPTPDAVMEALPRHNAVPAGASNVLVRASALAVTGGFDKGLAVHEDWDLWLRLRRVGSPACVAEPLVGLRWHGTNVSLRTEEMLRTLPLMGRRHGRQVDVARHHRWAAWTELDAGRRRAAAARYLAAAAHGDVASIARSLVVLAAPGAVRRRNRGAPPGDWARHADEWLEGLR